MKRLTTALLACLTIATFAQQKIESFDKVTVPLVRIPNMTVAPVPSESMLYAVKNHLYFAGVRLDTLNNITIVNDTVGKDPACTGLRIYSLADSIAWQHSWIIDPISGDTTGCKWVDITSATWLSNGNTLYYKKGDVEISNNLYTSLIYPKPGTAAVNVIVRGISDTSVVSRFRIWGAQGGWVDMMAANRSSGDLMSNLQRIDPYRWYIQLSRNNVVRQKLAFDSASLFPEVGDVPLGNAIHPFSGLFLKNLSTAAPNDNLMMITGTGEVKKIASSTFSPTVNFSNTLWVGSGRQYSTIQAAINASTPGTTIIVGVGNYSENVAFTGKTNLTLIGEGKSMFNGTTLTGGVILTGRINIEASSGIKVDNMSVIRAGAQIHAIAIYAQTGNCNNVTISNCIVLGAHEANKHGISAEAIKYELTNILIENCQAYNFPYGIGVKGKNSVVRNCYVKNSLGFGYWGLADNAGSSVDHLDYVSKANNISFISCIADSCTIGFTSYTRDIQSETGSYLAGSSLRNVQFINCSASYGTEGIRIGMDNAGFAYPKTGTGTSQIRAHDIIINGFNAHKNSSYGIDIREGNGVTINGGIADTNGVGFYNLNGVNVQVNGLICKGNSTNYSPDINMKILAKDSSEVAGSPDYVTGKALRSGLDSKISSQWGNYGSNIGFGGGNVGIGLTNPAYLFDVNGEFNSTNLRVRDTSVIKCIRVPGGNSLTIVGTSSPSIKFWAEGTNPVLRMVRYNGSVRTPSAVTTGQSILSLQGAGYNGSGESANKVTFGGLAAENWSPTANGALAFISTTTNGTTTQVERLRLTDKGDLGVGTTAPVEKTEVAGRVKATAFYTENDYQGLAWNENTDAYVRLGTLAGKALSATPGDQLMPVQAGMRGCVMQDNGTVNYYLFPADWTYKEDFTASTLTGADGQVMVEIPKFYFKYSYAAGWHIYKISKYPLTGFTVHPAFVVGGVENDYTYIGAYEASLYNVTSSIYANGVYQPAHSVSFVSSTKTISKLAGSVATVNMTGANGGTGYAVGNVLTLTGGTLASTCTVSTVSSGVVTAVTLTTKGYGCSTGVKATTGGAGTGCTINIATLEDQSNPYTELEVGDKLTISGSVSNNGTFTVATKSDQSFTVSETVTDETYALNAVISTKVVTTATTGDKLCSVSGKTPVVNQTRASFRNMSANRGSNWHQLGYDQVHAVELLATIEFGTFNWQNIAEIGPGITNIGNWPTYNNYNPFIKTGNANIIGNYSGDNAGAATIASEKAKYSKYRGIENFYGHLFKWVDGINVNNNRAYISSNYTTWTDDTSTGYTDIGADMPAATGYQEHLINSSRAILPSTIGGSGSASARITDYYSQSTGWRVGVFGGYANGGTTAGGFFWYLNYGSGYVYQYIGARLSFK